MDSEQEDLEPEQPSFRSGRSKQSRKPVDDAIELEDIDVKKKGKNDRKLRSQRGGNDEDDGVDLEMQSQSSRRKKPTKKKK